MCDINLPSVILAGGRSQRMKRKDKSFVEVGDKTLLDMTIERLQLQSGRVAINTNSHSLKYKRYGLPVLHDQVGEFYGPLAGILTAMKWAGDIGYEKVITVAVDTPLFPENLLQELHKKMEESNSDIVFAASLKDHKKMKDLHPVFGLWKTYLHDDLRKELVNTIRSKIGPIATPDFIHFAEGLPKTRSGKIMRRIHRKIAANEQDQLGDITTLADPSVEQKLIDNKLNN